MLNKGTNKSLIATSTPQEIYQYSDAILKHLPKNALKRIQNELLYNKKLMITMGGNDKQIHTNDNKVYRTDDNFEG